MDGRRETVYSEPLFYSHQRLLRGEPGSTSLVRDLAPDLVWLPVGSPAIAVLEREGWRPSSRPCVDCPRSACRWADAGHEQAQSHTLFSSALDVATS
jgi:hypothetical protein